MPRGAHAGDLIATLTTMDGKYLAVFNEISGVRRYDVDEAYFDLYDGEPRNTLRWLGREWTRATSMRSGVVHYLPSESLR